MSMLTLAISCLITSNLPWFMDLTFQVPRQYCSIASDFISIASHIHNWVVFALLLFWSYFSTDLLYWIYWTSTDQGTSSCSVLTFCLFILFMGFSRQEYWSGLPLPLPGNHVFISKFRLKLKKVGKTTRPFKYDLKQIPYDYTVEVRNRFKGLALIYVLKNNWRS